MTPPNILVVMCDQMTALALPMYGHRVTRTPNLSRLAHEGVLFENAYTTFPLCTPARASLATGQLPSVIGVYDNGAELPASIPTFAHYARLLGYQTSIVGKLHYIGPDQLHGFEERLTTDIYPASFEWSANWNAGTPRYEFDAHGGVSTLATVADAGPCARSMQINYDEEVLAKAVRKIFDLKRGEDARPFLLKVSFTHPHDPYLITREFWDQYTDEGIDMPAAASSPVENWDPHSRFLYKHFRMQDTPLSEAAIRRARHGYYGAISYVDHNVGVLMKALRDADLDRNTVVVFLVDHGDMMGEHGLWFKMTFFEWAMRIPLLVWAPARFPPKRVMSNVSLVDILPTIVELAGGSHDAVSDSLPGRSLVPALESGVVAGPNVVFAEHTDGGTPSPRVMVRLDQWKYVVSLAFPPQLFDLKTDPLELHDLAGLADVADTQGEVQGIADRTWNLRQLEIDVKASQRRRRVVFAALSNGRYESWDYQVPQNAAKTYVRHGDRFPGVEQQAYVRYPEPD